MEIDLAGLGVEDAGSGINEDHTWNFRLIVYLC